MATYRTSVLDRIEKLLKEQGCKTKEGDKIILGNSAIEFYDQNGEAVIIPKKIEKQVILMVSVMLHKPRTDEGNIFPYIKELSNNL